MKFRIPPPPPLNRAYCCRLRYTDEARAYVGSKKSLGVGYLIAAQMSESGASQLDGQVQIVALYHLRTTKHGALKKDADGSIKMLFDVFEGLAYENDRVVRRFLVETVPLAAGEEDEYVEVWIEPFVPLARPEANLVRLLDERSIRHVSEVQDGPEGGL